MIRHHHPRALATVPTTRARDIAGAALVELAFVSLMLMTLTAGAYDYGMAYREALMTNEAARTAARTGSALAKSPLADWYALSGAAATLTNAGKINDVQKVIIYRADATDGNVPAACTTATSSTLKCNVISGTQFRAMTQSSFDTTTGCFTAATIKNWCPSSRINVQLTSEYYGVWIQMNYTHLFKFLKTTTTMTRDAVMRLEPDVS